MNSNTTGILKSLVQGTLREEVLKLYEGFYEGGTLGEAINNEDEPKETFIKLVVLAGKQGLGTRSSGRLFAACIMYDLRRLPTNQYYPPDIIHRMHNIMTADTGKIVSMLERLVEGVPVPPTKVSWSKNPFETPEPLEPLEPLGEEPMSKLTKYTDQLVTQVTLLNGVDVSELNEQQFFDKITKVQDEIANLRKLPESIYVTNRIDALEADLTTIINLMDSTLSV